MSILKNIKKKVGEFLETMKEDKEMNEKLRKIQGEFDRAKNNYDTELMDERELLYLGTHETDTNINTTYSSSKARKKANNVVNIIYEFIESQIDSLIPQPSVRSKYQYGEELANIIEHSLKNDIQESDIYRINDENERTTPIQGFSLMTVNWNPDKEHHLYRGEIELDNKHPKTLIPQIGVYDLNKMDYFFLIYPVTKEYVKKRYGVELKDDGEEYPEMNTIDGSSDNENNSSNLVDVIVKWYKDEDGNIGKFTWCNSEVLEDLKNYYSRKLKKCVDCGEVVYKDKCKCGSSKIKESNEEYETLTQDVVKSNGEIIPAMSPALDENGQVILDSMGQPKLEATKIKYFKPTMYPVILRKNVPIAFNFGGQSDIDIIRDQADSIKKVVSIIEEKIIRGGAIIKAKNGHKFELTNELYKVVRGEIDQLSQLQVMNLEAGIQQDILFVQEQYKAAQYTLGVTNSFQGKPDQTAQSGIAKQIQVQQATGRMQSKAFNKRTAFADLYRLMFEFRLAFYDETRPFIKEGTNGKPEYGEFSKYDFLQKDAAGEWYYNTDFIFSADGGEGLPKDKLWLMNQATQYMQQGLLNKVQFWGIMEKVGFPSAGDIKKQAEDEMQQQQQRQAQQEQIQQQQMQQSQQQQLQQKQEQQGFMQQQMQEKKQQQEFKNSLEIARLINNGG